MRRWFPSPHTALALAAMIVAGLWGGFLARDHLAGRASVLDRLDGPVTDLLFQLTGPRPAPSDVVIVALDDETAQRVRISPLPRDKLADLLRRIAERKPKVIGLDILLIDEGADETDEALATALRDSRTILPAVGLFDDGTETTSMAPGPLAGVPLAKTVVWPIEKFRDLAGIGVVNISTDRAGTPRYLPLIIRTEDTLLPSFPLRIAMAATGSAPVLDGDRIALGPISVPTDLGRNLPLRFYGPRGSIRTLSAERLLDGDVHGDVPSELIRDHVVIVGATALGTGDMFSTPFDPVLPGVEVLATAAANILEGGGLIRTVETRRVDAIAAVLLPVLTVLFIAVRRTALGLSLVGLLLAAWITLTIAAFARGYWLNASVPFAALAAPGVLYAMARLWLFRRTEDRLVATQEAMRVFQPPALAERLAHAPDYLHDPVQQRAAVLFVDLNGFTSASERLGPEKTRELLKALHTIVDDEATRHDGVTLNYMGDGAMLAFGMPDARPDDADRSVETAFGLIRRIQDWLSVLPPETRGNLGVRIGIHYGPVIISRLGGETHQQITISGDTVNVANRLLAVAAEHRALIAASADLVQALRSPSPIAIARERRVTVRGRAQPLNVRLWSDDETFSAEI